MKPFGDGVVRTIRVIADNRVIEVKGRTLYNSNICVICEGPWTGKLALPKWQNGKKEDPKNPVDKKTLMYVKYDDAYSLYRALIHGHEQYTRDITGEIPNMVSALQTTYLLNAILLGLKKGNVEECAKTVIEKLEEGIRFVNPNARLKVKKDVLDQFSHIAPCRDRRGVVNQTVLLARLVAAQNRLKSRESQATSIAGKFAHRRSVMKTMLSALQYYVDSMQDYLEQLLSKWESLAKRPDGFADAIEYLQVMAKLLPTFDVDPFRKTFFYVSSEFNDAAACLIEGRTADAKRILTTSYESLRLRQERVALERILLLLSRKVTWSDAQISIDILVSGISDCIGKITHLDTSRMMSFDKASITDSLLAVAELLRKKEYKTAKKQLSEIVLFI